MSNFSIGPDRRVTDANDAALKASLSLRERRNAIHDEIHRLRMEAQKISNQIRAVERAAFKLVMGD